MNSNKRYTPGFFVGPLLLLCCAPGAVKADCYGTTSFNGTSEVPIRLDGNHVKTYGQSWASGANYQYWTAHITSYAMLNGNRISSGFTYDGNVGASVASSLSTALQPNGPGAYGDQSYHWFMSTVCSNQSPYNLGYSTGTTLSILRPTRPDYASFSGNTHAVMFLGAGVSSSGNYSAQTVLVAGSANGASETPTWVFKAGSTFGTLNCTNCTQPLFTASKRATGCNAYDVVLATSYNAFESDQFFMFINTPHNTVVTTDAVTGETWKSTDEPYGSSGWLTRFNYKSQGLCASDAPLSGYDMNEQFGGFGDDYYQSTGVHNNWTAPPCSTNPNSGNCGFSVGGDSWKDTMAYDCGACTPSTLYPGSDYTKVQSAQQTWRVGSGRRGPGRRSRSTLISVIAIRGDMNRS